MNRNGAGSGFCILFSFLLVFIGCHKVEKKVPLERTAVVETSAAGERDAIKMLPCFKCHIYNRFMKEPQKGFFSHLLHSQFEYHCNQCHTFRGHKEMTINKEICINCHGKIPELKRKG